MKYMTSCCLSERRDVTGSEGGDGSLVPEGDAGCRSNQRRERQAAGSSYEPCMCCGTMRRVCGIGMRGDGNGDWGGREVQSRDGVGADVMQPRRSWDGEMRMEGASSARTGIPNARARRRVSGAGGGLLAGRPETDSDETPERGVRWAGSGAEME